MEGHVGCNVLTAVRGAQVRYYFTKGLDFGGDGDFAAERFVPERYLLRACYAMSGTEDPVSGIDGALLFALVLNADLANDVGNLLQVRRDQDKLIGLWYGAVGNAVLVVPCRAMCAVSQAAHEARGLFFPGISQLAAKLTALFHVFSTVCTRNVCSCILFREFVPDVSPAGSSYGTIAQAHVTPKENPLREIAASAAEK
eukprot:223020-Rhodomonas_salina.3